MIAANLNAVKAKYGADRVLFYCGDPKEPRPPVMRLARYFESPNYGCESSVACNLAYVHAEELSYGQEIAGGPSPKTKCDDRREERLMGESAWVLPQFARAEGARH